MTLFAEVRQRGFCGKKAIRWGFFAGLIRTVSHSFDYRNAAWRLWSRSGRVGRTRRLRRRPSRASMLRRPGGRPQDAWPGKERLVSVQIFSRAGPKQKAFKFKAFCYNIIDEERKSSCFLGVYLRNLGHIRVEGVWPQPVLFVTVFR